MMGDLGKLIAAKGFQKLPKVQKIARSGHTACSSPLTRQNPWSWKCPSIFAINSVSLCWLWRGAGHSTLEFFTSEKGISDETKLCKDHNFKFEETEGGRPRGSMRERERHKEGFAKLKFTLWLVEISHVKILTISNSNILWQWLWLSW